MFRAILAKTLKYVIQKLKLWHGYISINKDMGRLKKYQRQYEGSEMGGPRMLSYFFL